MEHPGAFALLSWTLRTIAAVICIALPAVDDHGELFALAVVVFACSLAVLALRRQELPFLRKV